MVGGGLRESYTLTRVVGIAIILFLRGGGRTLRLFRIEFSWTCHAQNMPRIDFKVDYCLQSQRKMKYCFLFPNGWFIIFIV